MSRVVISITFSFLLSIMVTLPTIISVFEQENEISIVFDISEEENKEGKSFEDVEFKYLSTLKNIFTSSKIKKHNFYQYSLNIHSQLYKECISPPPEI